MGMRETMENKKGLSTGLAVALLVVGVGGIVWQLMARGGDTWDGQTFFTASAANVAPFDHDGKQAVKAIVYQCDGRKFVAYMERFTPEARTVMANNSTAAPRPAPSNPANAKISPEMAARAALPPPSPAAAREASMNGREFKRPGDKEWVRSTNRGKVMEIKTITCPGGGKGTPTPVFP